MKPELKRLLVLNLPYLLFVYLFAKCGQAYRLAAGVDASAKLLHLTGGISAAFANPLSSLHPFDLCVGLAGAVAVRLIVYSKSKNTKKYRKGEEYGSARWGTAKDIAPYIDPKFENNILLTQTERLTMTGRPKDPKTARNKNVLVIGGSGSGKTRFYVKPNLMQCFPTSDYPTSFVVTDPKGTLVLETGQMFQRAGYRVKILNTINFSKSMKYNPFVYIHSEKDVLKLVNTLIANTKGEGEKSAEDFWVKSERLFYTALIGYIWYEAPAEEMNFTTLLEMINVSEAREDDPEFQSPVDLMFERLEQKDPDHFAVRQYKKFLLSAGKTRSSILISCGARLAPFDIREVRELMEDDEMELDTIGDEKTVLFLIMSDTDTTFNFILAMLQSQLINLLCDRADDKYGGRLPVHVRLILDEFANIGQMHDFDTSMFFRWIFKSAFAILIVSNTWNIVMGVFDATQSVVNQSSGVIIGETSIHFDRLIPGLEIQLESMTIGSLLSLWFQTLVVGLTMNILSICIFLVTYGRMIEIYVVTALGPIPLATMGSSEWRSTGQNYLKSLLALGFQAFLIMIVVGIYAVLIRNISGAADIAGAIWGCMGYTVLLCFCLFKTGSISKSVFGAH